MKNSAGLAGRRRRVKGPAIRPRLELVVTLGTGVGTALFRDGQLMPHLELAHHPLRGRRTYNEFVGDKARKKAGNRRWNRRVRWVVGVLRTLLNSWSAARCLEGDHMQGATIGART